MRDIIHKIKKITGLKKIRDINFKDNKKGIALVIAITTMTLLLSISLSISNIVLRQIRISTVNNSSKAAFFTADSAIECAFYYDTVASTTISSQTNNIDNDDISKAVFGPTITKDVLQNFVKCGNGIYVTTPKITANSQTVTNFDIDYGDMCANVTVSRSEFGTKISSSGYNTSFIPGKGCDLSGVDTKRLVERGLTITY
jgi:Tfp pilus assembly protein PilX